MSRVNYCGSSYGFLKSWAIKDGWYPNPTVGYIDVYYNSSNGNNCVITRANDGEVGGANHIIAGLRKSGSSTWKLDGNNSNYTSYAGPLYVYAAGSCIDIYGELNYTSGGTGPAAAGPSTKTCTAAEPRSTRAGCGGRTGRQSTSGDSERRCSGRAGWGSPARPQNDES